jgi:hypothetical protein
LQGVSKQNILVMHAQQVDPLLDALKGSELPVTSPNLMQCSKDRIGQLAGKITVEAIFNDAWTLPLHWLVVASETNQEIEGPTGKKYPGVAGGWPHSDLRRCRMQQAL